MISYLKYFVPEMSVFRLAMSAIAENPALKEEIVKATVSSLREKKMGTAAKSFLRKFKTLPPQRITELADQLDNRFRWVEVDESSGKIISKFSNLEALSAEVRKRRNGGLFVFLEAKDVWDFQELKKAIREYYSLNQPKEYHYPKNIRRTISEIKGRQ
jgi:hypothetical protein